MGAIPDGVRRQALHAFSTLPPVPGWRVVEGTHVIAALHPLPYPQPVEAQPNLTEAEIDAAIDEARALVREHGRDVLIWIAGPDHPWLADALARRGLRNEDSPGFESVENAMALVRPPDGERRGGVDVILVESFEEFAQGTEAELVAFEVPPEGRAKMEAELEERFAEYTALGNPFKRWIARIDGDVVGTAGAVYGEAGINLFGGGVIPQARGRGVYRALTSARWDAAVRRGTPALTVQAGRMSRPALERLGFEFIAEMPTYLDQLGDLGA